MVQSAAWNLISRLAQRSLRTHWKNRFSMEISVILSDSSSFANTEKALVWWPREGCIVVFEGLFSGPFWWSAWRSFQRFHFSYWERNVERSALKLRQQQGNKRRNKVGKFKLYYPHDFRVSRSTKISHTFPYDIWPPGAWAACGDTFRSGFTNDPRESRVAHLFLINSVRVTQLLL